MSPSPSSSHEATVNSQAKAAPYLFTGEKAGLWVAAAQEQMLISAQKYQTGDKVLFFFSILDSAASGGSLNKGLCYKLITGHTPRPKNYLWDLATQFKAIENK